MAIKKTDTTKYIQNLDSDVKPAKQYEMVPLPPPPFNITPNGPGLTLQKGTFFSPNYRKERSGWNIDAEGNAEFNDGVFRGDLVIGGLSRTIDSDDDIQDALDFLNADGGGTLYLKSGTYTISTALTGYSSISLIGISPSETILDFNNTSANLSFVGSNVYTTGTITSITGGVNVTGSGTAWLANVSAGQHLFLGTRWYLIAAVTGDTTLVLAEGYGDDVAMPGASYRIATPVQNIRIEKLAVKDSTGTGLVLTDCRRVVIDNVLSLTNNKGGVFTHVAEFNADRLQVVGNTSNGIELTNVGLSDWESVNVISNGGHGVVMNNVKSMTVYPMVVASNTSDGLNITTGVDLVLAMSAEGNGGQGVELVSGCSNVVFNPGIFRGNTGDGIKLTATSDNCKIQGGESSGNGGHGINIAASTCDNNLILAPTLLNNTSGGVSDSGTSTVRIQGTDSNFFGGSGSDGALTISSGTTTINCANAALVIKEYTSISITGTGQLAFSNPHANGTIVILKSQGNVTITSSASPAIDMSAMGGAGGAGASSNNSQGNDGSGGNSSDLLATNPGQRGSFNTGGSDPLADGGVKLGQFISGVVKEVPIYCGAGGGGAGRGDGGQPSGSAGGGASAVTDGGSGSFGTGGGAGTGGNGGRGGGGLYIEVGGAYSCSATLSVAGAAGTAGAASNGSGGGGGGGGGMIILYNSLTSDTGTYTVSGGSGGAAAGTGAAGAAGGAGYSFVGPNMNFA